MGKVDRLPNRFEPVATLFRALGIVLYLPTTDPARRPGITQPHHSTKTRRLSPFSYLGMLFIYGSQSICKGGHAQLTFLRYCVVASSQKLKNGSGEDRILNKGRKKIKVNVVLFGSGSIFSKRKMNLRLSHMF